MFCPNCGTNISFDQKFCRACGLGLEKVAQSLAEQLPTQLQDNLLAKKNRLERLGVTALSIFGLGFFALLVYMVGYKLMISQGKILAALGVLGIIVLIASGLLSVILFAKANEVQEEASKRRLKTYSKSCRHVLVPIVLTAFVLTGCINKSLPRKNNIVSAADPALVINHRDSPTNGDSREPELNATSDGRIILSWVEKLADKRYALRAAISDGKGWSEAHTVAQGDNWFINWADFPSVIALEDGSLAAHWLVKSGSGTYAYNVNISRSNDGGKTWSKTIVPHLDNTQTEHGFVSLVPLSRGMLGAIWLDGRNMKDMKDDHEEDRPLPVSMTLRYATIDANGQLSNEAELDERVCECCQTSATVTSDGVVAVYRDRSLDEVRDIYSVRQSKGDWSSPQVVHADNWTINGCPVNGPSVAADGRNVAVAWFTGADSTPKVYVAFSADAGATFGRAIQVDDGETQGRVDVLLLTDGSALVCWLAGNAEGGAIKVRRIHPDGRTGTPSVIAKTDISRSSGFPRMARLGSEVHFAWTEFGKPSRVRTATADVSAYK